MYSIYHYIFILYVSTINHGSHLQETKPSNHVAPAQKMSWWIGTPNDGTPQNASHTSEELRNTLW